MSQTDLGAVGSLIVKKISGSGALASGTETVFGAAMAQPINPNNFTYPGAINSSDNLSLKLAGNKTPAFGFRVFAKSSFLTAALINSLIITKDSAGYTDLFAIQLKSQYRTRKYELCRCNQVVISHNANGGPVILDIAFAAVYGDSESPSPTTFSTSPTPDGGSLIDKSQVNWASTADQVNGSTITLSRVQAPQFSDSSGTLYADVVASGPFSSSLMLNQRDTATIIPGSAATIQIGTTGAGIAIAMNLNLDAVFIPQDFGFVNRNMGYTGFNSGAIPVAITAL